MPTLMIVDTYMATATSAKTTINTIFFFLGVIDPILELASVYHSARLSATATMPAGAGIGLNSDAMAIANSNHFSFEFRHLIGT
jgi:hypothetical protein